MQLRHYIRLLLGGWWIIILAALSGLTLALASAYVEQPRYRTSARLIVSPNPTLINSGQFIYSIDTLDKRSIVTTYSEVLNSSRLFDETGRALKIAPGEMTNYNHSTVVIPEANILELFVDGPNPEVTALLANSLSQRAIDYVRAVYQVYDLDVLDPADVPTSAFSPRPARDAALALVLGGVIGAVLAILEEQLKLPLEALRRRNTLDPVSQALNHRAFEQTAKGALLDIETATLGLIGLEGMREILDTMPSPASQRVLREIRLILRNELRGSDIISRWNDTTFAVLLLGTPEQPAARTLERITLALRRPLRTGFEDETVGVKPYIGAATAHGSISFSALAEAAETALRKSSRAIDPNVLLAKEPEVEAEVPIL